MPLSRNAVTFDKALLPDRDVGGHFVRPVAPGQNSTLNIKFVRAEARLAGVRAQKASHEFPNDAIIPKSRRRKTLERVRIIRAVNI